MDPVYFALVAAGMGALWWRHLRHHYQPRTHALGTVFDADAEVVLHVAAHEARSRGGDLTSVHVLYGLLQDERITAAMREAGVDPDALEDRVLRALDAATGEDAHDVYGRAAAHANHAERRATTTDLWAYLRGTAAAQLLDNSVLARVLFQLCHGSEPELPATILGSADVHAVLRNDDYTTQDFVCMILEEVFDLDKAAAQSRMLQTHTQGRAVIGRFRPDDARVRIEAVRARARALGFPLWIGVEPV